MTNKQERPHLVKAYKDLAMPAFNQHVYTNEEGYRALRWVQERGINLRGFRLELKDRWVTVRKSVGVLVELMIKGSRWYDMKIAKYYATRGKLTYLGARYRGYTALTYASQEGHLDIMEALLVAGADKDKSDINGDTPLGHAARHGHVECLKALLSAGVAKDKAATFGDTPLIHATQEGHVECVKELLAVGADVKKANNSGRTSLIYASIKGHVEIVKLLLAAGAKQDKIDISGRTALTYATAAGHHEIVQLLQQAA